MITFNEKEKEIIRNIVSMKTNNINIGNIFVKEFFEGTTRFLGIDRIEKVLKCDALDKDLPNDLTMFVSLIEYLKENNFIFCHKLKKESEGNFLSTNITIVSERFIDLRTGKEYKPIPTSIPTSLYDSFTDLLDCFVYLKHSLIDLVDNGFISPEERLFKEEMLLSKEQHKEAIEKANTQIDKAIRALFWSRTSFIVALLALIFTIVMPIILK